MPQPLPLIPSDKDLRRTEGGALTGAGRAYVFDRVPAMNDAGFMWLTSIVREMADGDPWQEAVFALDIVEAWEDYA